MAYGSGLSAQIGAKAETTVGTAVTVDTFYEFNSESIAFAPTWLRGEGLKAGQAYSRASRIAQSRKMVAGDVEMEHADRGHMGLLWRHAVGSAFTTPVQISTSSAYEQVHVPNSSGKVGLALTVQVGRPQTDGTVRPHTYSGVKVVSWEFSCTDNEIAKFKLTLDGWDEATATALASASYTAAAGVFSFEDASTFTLGGTASTGGSPSQVSISGGTAIATLVKSVTIAGTTPLATERFGLGNAGVKKEQLDNGFPTATIKLDAEYTSRAELYDLMKANTTTAFQLDFSQSDAGGTNPFRLSFIAAACKVMEGSPAVSGPDIVPSSYTLEAFDDGTNAPLQVRLVSTDTTL